MSIALYQMVKALQARVDELEKEKKPESDLGQRVKELENRYRMLNARLSRKKQDGETDRI